MTVSSLPKRIFGNGAAWMTLAGAILILFAAFAVYSPVLHGKFLWDDEFLVLRNPFIRSPILGMEVFRHFLFTESRGEFYRPVQNLAYIIDYWRAGLNAEAFHGTNVLIHGVNGLLVFLLVKKLLEVLGSLVPSRAVLLAFFVAALWVVHPVHSAIAAYISGRADSLALAGFLGGWLLWESGMAQSQKMARGKLAALFFFAFVLGLAACCSKEIALAGLGLFIAYLWLLRVDLASTPKMRTTMAVVAILGGYLLLRQLPDRNIIPPGGETTPLAERSTLFLRAIGDYARLFIFPDRLFMERQVSIPTGLFTDPVKNDPLFPYLEYTGAAAVMLLAISLYWGGRGRQLRLLGVIWTGIMILPVSNLFSLNATVAEHWLYFPMIGLCLWLAGCWLGLPGRLQNVTGLLIPLLVVALGWRANQRAADWRDSATFYRATIRAGGDSVRIRINLAAEYQKTGQFKEAERIYRSVLRAIPDFQLARVLLAQNLAKQNRRSEAAALVAKGVGMNGGETERTTVMELLGEEHQYSEIARRSRAAYERNPNSWPMAKALAKAYEQMKQPRVSLEIIKGFSSRNWWHAEARNELGELYAANNFPALAIESYCMAARLDIRNAEPLNQAAILLAGEGKFREALALQGTAIVRSDAPREREILALIKKAAAEQSAGPSR